MGYIELLTTAYLFNPPMPMLQYASLLEGTHQGREILRMLLSSPFYICKQLFENDRIRTWILLHVTQTGIPFDCFGNGLMFPMMFPALHRCGIGTSVGGSISLSLAMQRVIETNGGEVKTRGEVKEIMVKDGIARGVRLADGTEFLAEKAIACNVGPTLIFGDEKMIEERDLPRDFMDQVRHWRSGEVALFTLHLALSEPIQYKAALKEPDINRTYTVGCCESTEVLQRQFNAPRLGEIPRGDALGFLAVMPTVIDPTQAPEGRHTAFIWQYSTNCDYVKEGAEKWDEIKAEYEQECLEHWAKYTHNLKKPGVILKRHSDTPLDIVRRNPSMIGGDFSGGDMNQDQMGMFRPFHGYPPYRTPIENLWLCGPSSHPAGGCCAGPGYNAANAIADTLKIKKWWPKCYFGGAPEEEV